MLLPANPLKMFIKIYAAYIEAYMPNVIKKFLNVNLRDSQKAINGLTNMFFSELIRKGQYVMNIKPKIQLAIIKQNCQP